MSDSIWKKDLFAVFRSKKAWKGPRYVRARKKSAHLILVLEELTALTGSGSPLAGGLARAAMDLRSGRLKAVLQAMSDLLSEGHTLSESMVRLPLFFPQAVIDAVKVGEETGKVHENLSNATEALRRSRSLSTKVLVPLVYVMLLVCIYAALGGFLSVSLFPRLTNIENDIGIAAGPRQSDAIKAPEPKVLQEPALQWGLLLALSAGAMTAVSVLVGKVTRYGSHGVLAHLLPGINQAVKKEELSRVASILSCQLKAGVPLVQALDNASQLDLSPGHKRILLSVRDKVNVGNSLGGALKEAGKGLPRGFFAMIHVGENSARLPEALAHLSRTYAEQAEQRLRTVLDAAFPLLIIGAGLLYLSICRAAFDAFTTILHAMTL